MNSIVVLVVICFLIGIDRAWELVGGPSIGISQEVVALVRGNEHGADDPADKESPPQRPDPNGLTGLSRGPGVWGLPVKRSLIAYDH